MTITLSHSNRTVTGDCLQGKRVYLAGEVGQSSMAEDIGREGLDLRTFKGLEVLVLGAPLSKMT